MYVTMCVHVYNNDIKGITFWSSTASSFEYMCTIIYNKLYKYKKTPTFITECVIHVDTQVSNEARGCHDTIVSEYGWHAGITRVSKKAQQSFNTKNVNLTLGQRKRKVFFINVSQSVYIHVVFDKQTIYMQIYTKDTSP